MKFEEVSASRFLNFNTFGENKFLIVHHSLVEKSELIRGDSSNRFEQSNSFFSFTYTQIFNFVKKISEEMSKEGIKANELIPILFHNPFDLILSTLSLWSLGSIPVPLNIHLLKEDLISEINFLKAKHIICETKFANYFPFIKRFSISNTPSEPQSIDNLLSSNIAVILFTSGTSGKSKAVPLNYANLFAAFDAGNSIFNYLKDDSWYLNLPLYHIGGFSILARAILAGSSIILPESNELDSLKNNLDIVKPTLVSLVATQLKRICEHGIRPNKELRAALIGGGFSDETILIQAANLGWNIYKVYGSTETSAFVTALTPKEIFQKLKSIGKPLKHVEIKIFDEQRHILPADGIGEIGINAPSIFRNYLDNKTDSDAAFYNQFYLTGDFGFYDTDGFLYLENRRTDLIVSGGENISPIEIEQVISLFPNVDEVCVFGLPDKEWGEMVTAVIITKDKNEINFSELRVFLKEKLSSFKVPKKYFQLDSLPKSAIGKIKRSELKKLFSGSTSTHT